MINFIHGAHQLFKFKLSHSKPYLRNLKLVKAKLMPTFFQALSLLRELIYHALVWRKWMDLTGLKSILVGAKLVFKLLTHETLESTKFCWYSHLKTFKTWTRSLHSQSLLSQLISRHIFSLNSFLKTWLSPHYQTTHCGSLLFQQ